MSMSKIKHKNRHIKLHKYFDELIADYMFHTGNLPSETTLKQLVDWSYEQTQKPSEKEHL